MVSLPGGLVEENVQDEEADSAADSAEDSNGKWRIQWARATRRGSLG